MNDCYSFGDPLSFHHDSGTYLDMKLTCKLLSHIHKRFMSERGLIATTKYTVVPAYDIKTRVAIGICQWRVISTSGKHVTFMMCSGQKIDKIVVVYYCLYHNICYLRIT